MKLLEELKQAHALSLDGDMTELSAVLDKASALAVAAQAVIDHCNTFGINGDTHSGGLLTAAVKNLREALI